jgi:YD repeat-containing protein
LTTTYNYDGLNDLVSVNQHGNSGSDTPRTRSFTYDGLSRLVCSSNPENSSAACPASVTTALPSGVIGYGYDENGNLRAKTDARGITTNFSYDALNHLLSKSYSGDPNNTASSCFQYGSSATGNTIGRLVNEWTQSGTCPTSPPANSKSLHTILVYDSMGRITEEQRCTGILCTQQVYRAMTYSYDLAGNQTGSGDGLSGASALSFVTQYDQAGQLLNFSGGVTGGAIPLFSVQSYSPAGWTGATIGSQLSAQRTYDNRARLTGETVIIP